MKAPGITTCLVPMVPLLALGLAAAAGCTSPQLKLLGASAGRSSPAQPAPADSRNEAALRQFEENRDRAEYQAAEARWRQQDLPGCEARLARLLERNPAHQDARRLRAQVLAATGRDAAQPPQQLAAARREGPRPRGVCRRLPAVESEQTAVPAAFVAPDTSIPR
jgi:hypothetical protein